MPNEFAVIDRPKRNGRKRTVVPDDFIAALSKALAGVKDGQAIAITTAYESKAMASSHAQRVRLALMDKGMSVRGHVIESDGGYVAAISLRK